MNNFVLNLFRKKEPKKPINYFDDFPKAQQVDISICHNFIDESYNKIIQIIYHLIHQYNNRYWWSGYLTNYGDNYINIAEFEILEERLQTFFKSKGYSRFQLQFGGASSYHYWFLQN